MSKVVTTISIMKTVKEAGQAAAEKQGVPFSQFVSDLIKKEVKRAERANKQSDGE